MRRLPSLAVPPPGADPMRLLLFADEQARIVAGQLVLLAVPAGERVALVVSLCGRKADVAGVPGPVEKVRGQVGDVLLDLLASGPGGVSSVAARVAAVSAAADRLARVCGRAAVRRWWVSPCSELGGRCPLQMLATGWLPTQPQARAVLDLAG